MLYLIGAGISGDFTLEGVEALKKCDEIYIEVYTNPPLEDKIKDIEKLTGKEVMKVDRKEVESDFLLGYAKDKTIALISGGDPLTATTHISLVIEARKQEIPVKIIHNSSVYTAAAGRAGLQIYRFGKTASLVNPRPNYRPTSSLDIIRNNLRADMHTLVLLDTEPKPMEAEAALGMLSEFGMAVVLSRLGENDEKISYGEIDDLKNKNLGKPPFSVIIPATLHPIEEEYLEAFLHK